MLAWDGDEFTLDELLSLVLFVGWNLLPALALAALVLLCARRFPIGLPVVAVGCVVYTAVTVWLLLSALLSESSTAGFLFVSLPLILGAIVGVFAAAAGTVDAARRPKAPILK